MPVGVGSFVGMDSEVGLPLGASVGALVGAFVGAFVGYANVEHSQHASQEFGQSIVGKNVG